MTTHKSKCFYLSRIITCLKISASYAWGIYGVKSNLLQPDVLLFHRGQMMVEFHHHIKGVGDEINNKKVIKTPNLNEQKKAREKIHIVDKYYLYCDSTNKNSIFLILSSGN